MIQKFTPKTLLPFLTIFFLTIQLQAQTGCPGCQINVPAGLPADTIYLDDFPDGAVNEAYETDLSFRLPMTTTPVAANDPTVFPNIDLDQIKITGIGNLPPGLSYEPNQEVYELPGETDGCAKICGTPLLPGTYMIDIFLEVKISFLVQNTSFQKILVITGGSSNNDGFSTDQSIGCGEVAVNFQNNIPSNGVDGFSYSWDFGNGTTSIDENPVTQIYSTPGSYPVTYQAVVDTFGYLLTNITVTDSDCNDILSALDLYLVLEDPSGNVVSTANIENTNPPVQFPLNYEIGAGNYTLTVMDEDGGINGGDDICGIFTINQLTGMSMSSGGTDIELTILHPVDTIQTIDSIHVYPTPDEPVISSIGNEITCEGDSIILMSSQDENNQWFLDGAEIPGGNTSELVVYESGMYSVMYTNEFGCSSSAEALAVSFSTNPMIPEFEDDNTNLLSLSPNIEVLPDYAFQWYYENALLAGETASSLCIEDSGSYTLEVTDMSTGCMSLYTGTGTINPEYFCGAVNVEAMLENSLNIYPNPFSEILVVELELDEVVDFSIYLTDVLGRRILLDSAQQFQGAFQKSFDMTSYNSGVYFLEIQLDEEKLIKKVIKQ